jgi:hypothetical protein
MYAGCFFFYAFSFKNPKDKSGGGRYEDRGVSRNNVTTKELLNTCTVEFAVCAVARSCRNQQSFNQLPKDKWSLKSISGDVQLLNSDQLSFVGRQHTIFKLLRSVTVFHGRHAGFQHCISCCFGY